MAACSGCEKGQGIHLIADDGQLLSEKEIQDYLFSALGEAQGSDALHRVGVNYHVVGVFGGQSSGKSTLLNYLFQTQFQTMDESRRRGQTTRGAFLALADFEDTHGNGKDDEVVGAAENKTTGEGLSHLFVVDFEGTDGIERGEDQSFERQLSLFALSITDTLIINMWAVDVGRYNGANMSLLRTIFEVNLQLFSHVGYIKEEKPTLLIVLRDFTEDPSYTLYSFETVRKSFDTIWNEVVKPDNFKDSSIDTLFNLRYHALPHYKLQRHAFEEEVKRFRDWFYLSTSEKYLFHNKAMLRGVPLDGIPSYISSCWEMIRTSKELDIPTQREMLSKHRCEEAKCEANTAFMNICRDYTERLERGEVVSRLSHELEREIDNLLSEFHTHTRLYQAKTVRETATELEEQLLGAELKVLGQYAKALASKVVAELDGTVSASVERILRWLIHEAKDIPFISVEHVDDAGGENGKYSDGMGQKDVLLTDNDKCKALVIEFWKRLCHSLQTNVEVLYQDHLSDQREGQSPRRHESFAHLVAKDAAVQESVAQAVLDAVYQKVHRRFASMAENAAETIHQAFERALMRKSDSTVRFFNTTKALQRSELQARQGGLVLLGCILYYRLKLVKCTPKKMMETSDQISRAAVKLLTQRENVMVRENSAEEEFFLRYTTIFEAPRYPTGIPVSTTSLADTLADVVDGDCVLLTQQAVQRAFDLYTQKCEFTMQVQLRAIEAGKQNLPVWVLPMMLILGWNEIWYVLSSPFLLVVLLIVAVTFFRQFFISKWALFEETGPVYVVAPIRIVLQQIRMIYQSVLPTLPNRTSEDNVQYRDPNSMSDVSASEGFFSADTPPTLTASSGAMRQRNRAEPSNN